MNIIIWIKPNLKPNDQYTISDVQFFDKDVHVTLKIYAFLIVVTIYYIETASVSLNLYIKKKNQIIVALTHNH